jgi:acetyl esterase/lipase
MFISCSTNRKEHRLIVEKNNIYIHNQSESFDSKIIQFNYKLIHAKTKIERNIRNNKIGNTSLKIPNSIARKFDLKTYTLDGRKVLVVHPKKNKTHDRVVLYSHGGAFIYNINWFQWKMIEDLIKDTGCIFIIPDYPLAPEFKSLENNEFMKKVYSKTINDFPNKKMILVGDSAGGGLSLSLALNLKTQKEIKSPYKIILLSPWVDLTHTNPSIAKYEKYDSMLNRKGLSMAADIYKGSLELTDFRVSPIYGDLKDLPKTTIFIGTNDILYPDAKKLNDLLIQNSVNTNYYEYPKMFHVWMAAPMMKEATITKKQITKEILN